MAPGACGQTKLLLTITVLWTTAEARRLHLATSAEAQPAGSSLASRGYAGEVIERRTSGNTQQRVAELLLCTHDNAAFGYSPCLARNRRYLSAAAPAASQQYAMNADTAAAEEQTAAAEEQPVRTIPPEFFPAEGDFPEYLLRFREEALETPDEEIKPQDAIAKIGEIAKAFQEFSSRSKPGMKWPDDYEEVFKERFRLLDSYFRFAIPALALTFSNLAVCLVILFTILAAINISGIGYDTIVQILSNVPLLGDLAAKLDPSLGNFAIGALIVDFTYPAVVALSLTTLVPKNTKMLANFAEEKELTARKLNERFEMVWLKTTRAQLLAKENGQQ